MLCLVTLPVPAIEKVDPVELEAFMDGVVNTTMQRDDTLGATAAVTQDGRSIFSKGYGFADKERWVSVESQPTLLRIGSVSNLFTWTALMQLREQGKVGLDTDVNVYLKALKVPATFEESITLGQLMKHTVGIEGRIVKLFGDYAW